MSASRYAPVHKLTLTETSPKQCAFLLILTLFSLGTRDDTASGEVRSTEIDLGGIYSLAQVHGQTFSYSEVRKVADQREAFIRIKFFGIIEDKAGRQPVNKSKSSM
jgi:hypothetical protein